jgi:hypothetical protein
MTDTIHDIYGITAEMEAEAMADCHEQERRETLSRIARAAADREAARYSPNKLALAIAEDRRAARAAAFAATPRGRRALAARAA